MKRVKTIDKQQLKHTAGKCRICSRPGYEVLDVHRIVPGAKKGKYTGNNTVVLCSCCHREIHAGNIIIDRYYYSTAGYLLKVIINGEEKFI